MIEDIYEFLNTDIGGHGSTQSGGGHGSVQGNGGHGNRLYFFNFRAFIISFAIGIFFVYVFQPPKRIVYKFPNPESAKRDIYEDKHGTCYKIEAAETRCDTNAKYQPIAD